MRGAPTHLLFALALAGCVVPPEGETPVPYLNYAPLPELDSLSPYTPITLIRADCSSFRVELGRTRDPDSEELRFRWVANNRTSSARWLRDFDVVSTATPGSAHRVFARVVPAVDFPDEVEQAENNKPTSGVLSLFITDAPAWAIAEPETPSADPQDLGQIETASDEESLRPYSVSEVRWTFTFGEEGSCP